MYASTISEVVPYTTCYISDSYGRQIAPAVCQCGLSNDVAYFHKQVSAMRVWNLTLELKLADDDSWMNL